MDAVLGPVRRESSRRTESARVEIMANRQIATRLFPDDRVVAAHAERNGGNPLPAKRILDPLHADLPTPPDTAASIASPPADATSHGCVLVVDDNEAVRETLADILESAGLRAIQAADAAQALMIMRERGDIDALVTDLSMPGADGITLIRHARGIRPGLPAILLTGYAEEASSVSTDTGGNFHVLRKPVESERLTEQIFLLITQARGI